MLVKRKSSHGSSIQTRFISSRLSFEPGSTSVVFRGIPFWSNPMTRFLPSSIHDSNQKWSSKAFFCSLMNITSNRLASLTCLMVLKRMTSACCWPRYMRHQGGSHNHRVKWAWGTVCSLESRWIIHFSSESNLGTKSNNSSLVSTGYSLWKFEGNRTIELYTATFSWFLTFLPLQEIF